MKSAEEIMNILEAFDLTASLRDAGELAGCSPNSERTMSTATGGNMRPAGARPAPVSSRTGTVPRLVLLPWVALRPAGQALPRTPRSQGARLSYPFTGTCARDDTTPARR